MQGGRLSMQAGTEGEPLLWFADQELSGLFSDAAPSLHPHHLSSCPTLLTSLLQSGLVVDAGQCLVMHRPEPTGPTVKWPHSPFTLACCTPCNFNTKSNRSQHKFRGLTRTHTT